MNDGTTDPKPTKPSLTKSPADTPEAQEEVRRLFERMSRVKQYPMDPDEPPAGE